MKTRRHGDVRKDRRGDTATRRHGDLGANPESAVQSVTQSTGSIPTASPRPRVPASPRPSLHPSSFILHASKRPSKALGQNFLVNRGVVERIIAALAPRGDETIIEIGPGQGALTAALIEQAGRVVAIEFDRQLIPVLNEQFAACVNFKLIEADALDTDFCAVIQPALKARIVANLPYNISTAILQRLIQQRECLNEMVLMLQREVVDRITAKPGSTERGFLTVLVEAYCEVEKLFDVAPGSFRPVPKVWSSVICLRPRANAAIEVGNEDLFRSVVSAGFAQRRKTILNNLRNAPGALRDLIKRHGGASIILCEAGIPLQRRAETLTLPEWSGLIRLLD
jgi:16S rRNA (adenine1518-N6/adenine1519-N6)-dimethyltransferase